MYIHSIVQIKNDIMSLLKINNTRAIDIIKLINYLVITY